MADVDRCLARPRADRRSLARPVDRFRPGKSATASLTRRLDEAHLGSLISAIERSIDELRLWMHWAAEGAPSPESQRAALQRAVVDFDRDVDWEYSIFE